MRELLSKLSNGTRAAIGAVVGLLLALLGAGWVWSRHLRVSRQIADRVAVATALREIAMLEERRAELSADERAEDAQLAAVDSELRQAKRAVVEAHKRGDGLSDAEVVAAFERLGY